MRLTYNPYHCIWSIGAVGLRSMMQTKDFVSYRCFSPGQRQQATPRYGNVVRKALLAILRCKPDGEKLHTANELGRVLIKSRSVIATINVRFSNRPFGVKRFQTIHHYSVDVAHGLVLLYGIGTKALVWGFLCQGICQGRASFSFVGFLI